MNVAHKILFALKFPLSILFKKLLNALKWKLKEINYRASILDTELRNQFGYINSTIDVAFHSSSCIQDNTIIYYNYVEHKFEILGSGLVQNTYTYSALGFEDNRYGSNVRISELDSTGLWLKEVVHGSHLQYSQSTWHLILSIKPNYSPIDWQKDVKSGFRWDAKTWHKDQGKLMKNYPGVDIKVPWELSRLQHLPAMTLSANATTGQKRNSILTEIICQTLDFIMANPIGMGVNFNCPMDIGIRNANMLICLDILKQYQDVEELYTKINPLVGGYIFESTKHILNNLEYRTGLTSNHYLANIMGTLFAGAYLSSDPTTDSWLLFSIQEIESCMRRQFFDDGSNFEGSTSYHRLSGEMMLWAALIILSLPKERIQKLQEVDIKQWKITPRIKPEVLMQITSNEFVFTDDFWSKLLNAVRFTDSITKQDGNIFQFGDNDSGRFIKLSLTGEYISAAEARTKYLNLKNTLNTEDDYWDENSLNHKAFLGAGIGLFDLTTNTQDYSKVEYEVFKSALKDRTHFLNYCKSIDKPYTLERINNEFKETLKYHAEEEFEFNSLDVDFTQNNFVRYFKDFQLVVIKNNSFSLALGGISNPNQHHSLGHTHNDKLAIELLVNGKDILFNPGTYVYTPNPEARYLFRSVKSHNTVSVNGMEQNRPLPGGFGLFNLRNETKFRLIRLTETEIIAEVKYRKIIHQRRIEIKPKSIIVHDWCNHKFEQHWNTGKPYSNGYGKRLA